MENIVINEICLFIIDKCEAMNIGNFETLSKMIIADAKRIQSKLSQHDVVVEFPTCIGFSSNNFAGICTVCGKIH